MSTPPKVLLVSTDTIGNQMAGPGIRYWNFARILAAQQPVTLAVPERPPMKPPPHVSIVPYGSGQRDVQSRIIATMIDDHDVIVSQMPPYQFLDGEILRNRHYVIDLYAPWFLEKLEYARVDPVRGEELRRDDLEILHRLLAIGDFYICASERQRDFWIGNLTAAGRLNTAQLDANPELRTLIDVVPLGIPEERPLPNGPGPRERFPVISPNDPVILWNGGIWNWLDPLTAVMAIKLIVDGGINARLAFMGVQSPGREVAEMDLVKQAKDLARQLKLLDSHVFFNDWVEFDQRQNWLLQSTLTISLHKPTIESRFAYRTRVLDNLWCRVPIVATEGDVLADIVSNEGLGRVVPPDNPELVAAAIRDVINVEISRDIRRRIAAVAQRYTWSHVTEPLLRYCREPWKNPSQGEVHEYVNKLERLYTETAAYARSLEQVVDEKNRALQEPDRPVPQPDPWSKLLQRWKRRA